MRKQNEFDDFIDKKVGGYASDVPTDLWDKLEARLDDQGRDGAGWWMNQQGWFGLLALIVSGGLIFSYTNSVSVTNVTANTPAVVEASNLTLDTSNDRPKSSPQNALIEIAEGDNRNTTNALRSSDSKLLVGADLRNNLSVDGGNLTKGSQKLSDYGSGVSDKIASLISSSPGVAKPVEQNRLVAGVTRDSESNTLLKSENISKPSIGTTLGDNEVLFQTNEKNSGRLNASARDDFPSQYKSERLTAIKDFENSTLSALIPKATNIENRAFNLPEINDRSEGVIGCKTKRKRNGIFHLELLVSPDVAFRSLESKNEQNESHMLSRDSSENFSNAYTVAARMAYVAESGVTLKSGLQFSQITERLSFTNNEELTSILINAVGDTISNNVLVPRNRISWNRYKHIDIPVLVGYEMGDGPWRLSFSGGVYINIDSWQRGQFISPDSLGLVNFTTAQPDALEVFRRNVGLSVYASVGASYQFADKMQFLIEPHYRHFLRSHTIEEYGLEQRYKTFGIFAGVRFTL